MRTPIGPSLQLVLTVADVFAEVSIQGIEKVWKRWLGPARFDRHLAQFRRQGWIEGEKESPGVERVVRLTPVGRLAALGGRDPLERWRRAWDGRWRLALFDVPEVERALRQKLQRRLREECFGFLQNSLWITPDPIDALKEAVRGAAIDVETFLFMEARPCGGESDEEIVRGAWDFDRINRNYDVYLEILAGMPKRGSGGAGDRAWLDAEWKAWRHAVQSDPLLPEALLPRTYRGRLAWERRVTQFQRALKGL